MEVIYPKHHIMVSFGRLFALFACLLSWFSSDANAEEAPGPNTSLSSRTTGGGEILDVMGIRTSRHRISIDWHERELISSGSRLTVVSVLQVALR